MGTLENVERLEDDEVDDGLTLVRQLADETLVAVVEMLRELELLYLVKAEVEAPALEEVLMELRQFPDTTELALEATGRPLRELRGDSSRFPDKRSRVDAGLFDIAKAGDLIGRLAGGSPRPRRVLFQAKELSSGFDKGRLTGG